MRIDGQTTTISTISNNGADVLSRLNPGDTVRAQVLENSGGELTLKLSDGSKVSASAMSPVDAGEGEFVNFVFRGMADGKLVLEAAGKNIQLPVDQTLQDIKNTLTDLKLPVTEQNIELAMALKSQNLPITADTMSKVLNLVADNADLKADSAAFLTASNLSNDLNNIEKLQSLLTGRLKISNDINELMKLVNGPENVPDSSNGKAASNNINNVLGRISELLKDSNSGLPVKSPVINNILEKLAAELVSEGINESGRAASGTQAAGSTTGTASNSTVTENTNANANTNASAANNTANSSAAAAGSEGEAENAAGGVKNTVSANNAVNSIGAAAISDKAQNGENTKAVNINPAEKSVIDGTGSMLKGALPLGKADLPILNSIKSHLQAMLSKEDIQPEEQATAKIIAKEITEVISKINTNKPAADNTDTAKVKQNRFEDAVSSLKNLFIKIDQNSDEINPVKLYKEMDITLQTLKSAIQQLPGGVREAAMNIANNLESNVNFINQLNNYSSYVQLPLSIFNQNTTGELYMLKKGSKARKLDPSNITVLISLDSNNIGRIDTLLSIDKKNVSTNFRLENSDVFKVLKDSHKMLYNSLLEKGYRLVDFTYRLMDEPINIVNFEKEAKKEFIKSPNNIDILV